MATNNAINNSLGTATFTSLVSSINGTVITDNNSNAVLVFFASGGGTPVNYLTVANSLTNNTPKLQVTGTDTNVSMSLLAKGTGGIILQGTGTNDSASAGYVGEYVTSNITFASATSLSNGTAKNVTSISLTAGDWDIFGNIFFSGIGITNPAYYAWTSTTSATLPDNSLVAYSATVIAVTAIAAGLSCPYLRVSIASTTTVYLSAQANFSAGTATACGSIFARRAR